MALARGQQPCLHLAHRRYGAARTRTGCGGNVGCGSPGRERGKEHRADGDRKCGQPAYCHGSAHKTLPAMAPRRMRGVRRLWVTGTACSQPSFAANGRTANVALQKSEVLVFVDEGGRCGSRASGNQCACFGHLPLLIKLRVPASIQADRGAQASSLQIEPDQPALPKCAADNELVPLADVAHVFELVLVQIRPECVEVAVLVLRAEHGPGGGRPLLLRVVVVLDADAAEERMEVVCDISGREDVWNIGAASGVDQHAVVEGHVGAQEDVDVRLYADGHDGEVAVEPSTPLGDGMLYALRALEAHDLVMCDQLDPGVAMDAGNQLPHLGSQHRVERGFAGKHRRYPHTHLSQGSSDLRSDETHADHHCLVALPGIGFDGVTVGGCAQLMDARQLCPRNEDAFVPSAGRDQQLAELDYLAGVQVEASLLGVETHRGGVDQLDVVLGEPLGRLDIPARQVLLATQVRLREWRPPKRHARLIPYEDETPGVTLLPQGPGGDAARHACP